MCSENLRCASIIWYIIRITISALCPGAHAKICSTISADCDYRKICRGDWNETILSGRINNSMSGVKKWQLLLVSSAADVQIKTAIDNLFCLLIRNRMQQWAFYLSSPGRVFSIVCWRMSGQRKCSWQKLRFCFLFIQMQQPVSDVCDFQQLLLLYY